MTSILAFFENLVAHPAIAIGAFALVSSMLTAIATFLTSIGDSVPSWLSTVLGFLGNVVHLINGSTPAAPAQK